MLNIMKRYVLQFAVILFLMSGANVFASNDVEEVIVVGSKITNSLFENIDEISAITIREEIEYSIRTFEPRVKLLDVSSIPNYDNNEYNVVITYQIIGAEVSPQQLEFVLLPSR